MSRRKVIDNIEKQVEKQISLEESVPAVQLTPEQAEMERYRLDLINSVPTYADVNEQKSFINKEAERLNALIKEALSKLGLSSFSVGDSSVVMTQVDKSTFDMEILLALVKEMGLTALIDTVEVVNLTRLEQMLYDPNVPNEVKASFSKAEVITTCQKLNVRKRSSRKE